MANRNNWMESFKAQISPIAYLLVHLLELKIKICFLRIRLSVSSDLSGMFLSTCFIIKSAFQKWAMNCFYKSTFFPYVLEPGPGTPEKHQPKRHRLCCLIAESYLPFIFKIIKLLIGPIVLFMFKIKRQKKIVICKKLDVVPTRTSKIIEAVASNKQINLWIISIRVNGD